MTRSRTWICAAAAALLAAGCSETVGPGSTLQDGHGPDLTAPDDATRDGTALPDAPRPDTPAPDRVPPPDAGTPDQPVPDLKGDPQPLPDAVPDLAQDVGCVPGTACYKDEYVIMGSKVTIVVNEQMWNPSWYLFDMYPPGSMTVPLRIKSTGFNQLTLVDVFFLPGGNPNFSLAWSSPQMPGGMPLTLMPGEDVSGSITYAPPANAPTPASILSVWSSDPNLPEFKIALVPKQSGPDIFLPLSAVNFGCTVFCGISQDFSIENAGNQPLVIQSLQFVKPSADWTIEKGVPAGTTIPVLGTPGYAPVGFTLAYCDNDNNPKPDSNQLAIYSNDPDENPTYVGLNVILPGECPN